MSQAIFAIKLDWKAFNVDLGLVSQWINANHAQAGFCGTQAASQLELWFTQVPSDADQEAIREYWDAITDSSDEAKKYKSAQQRQEEESASKAALQASASAKLKALGLTDAEIAAMIG